MVLDQHADDLDDLGHAFRTRRIAETVLAMRAPLWMMTELPRQAQRIEAPAAIEQLRPIWTPGPIRRRGADHRAGADGRTRPITAKASTVTFVFQPCIGMNVGLWRNARLRAETDGRGGIGMEQPAGLAKAPWGWRDNSTATWEGTSGRMSSVQRMAPPAWAAIRPCACARRDSRVRSPAPVTGATAEITRSAKDGSRSSATKGNGKLGQPDAAGWHEKAMVIHEGRHQNEDTRFWIALIRTGSRCRISDAARCHAFP